MPLLVEMNGFDLSTKILELDVNPRICFMSSGQINQEALREQYPTLSFIKKTSNNRIFGQLS
jgi:hypothetical protein